VSASVLYMSMSLDGYIAGPNDEPGNPGGDGFARLHEWFLTPDGEFFRPSGPAGELYDEIMSTGSSFCNLPEAAFWGTSADGAASDVGKTSRAAMSSGPASGLTGMETERVSASTTIEAVPEAVFAVLADPSAHADIDGTGWVRESLEGDRIIAAGQVFRMAMYHPNHPDKDYKVANRVEVFDEPRAIAWKPGTESPETGELSFGGWIWRYDLEVTGASRTTVTLTYDWSAVPPEVREYLQFPPFGQDHLDNSLQHLSDLVARNAAR
jgi:hypothetical protein